MHFFVGCKEKPRKTEMQGQVKGKTRLERTRRRNEENEWKEKEGKN